MCRSGGVIDFCETEAGITEVSTPTLANLPRTEPSTGFPTVRVAGSARRPFGHEPAIL